MMFAFMLIADTVWAANSPGVKKTKIITITPGKAKTIQLSTQQFSAIDIKKSRLISMKGRKVVKGVRFSRAKQVKGRACAPRPNCVVFSVITPANLNAGKYQLFLYNKNNSKKPALNYVLRVPGSTQKINKITNKNNLPSTSRGISQKRPVYNARATANKNNQQGRTGQAAERINRIDTAISHKNMDGTSAAGIKLGDKLNKPTEIGIGGMNANLPQDSSFGQNTDASSRLGNIKNKGIYSGVPTSSRPPGGKNTSRKTPSIGGGNASSNPRKGPTGNSSGRSSWLMSGSSSTSTSNLAPPAMPKPRTGSDSSNNSGSDSGSGNSGGTGSGGTDSGGTNTGGSDSGGTNTGGSDSGGTNTGGTDSGDTASTDSSDQQANDKTKSDLAEEGYDDTQTERDEAVDTANDLGIDNPRSMSNNALGRALQDKANAMYREGASSGCPDGVDNCGNGTNRLGTKLTASEQAAMERSAEREKQKVMGGLRNSSSNTVSNFKKRNRQFAREMGQTDCSRTNNEAACSGSSGGSVEMEQNIAIEGLKGDGVQPAGSGGNEGQAGSPGINGGDGTR